MTLLAADIGGTKTRLTLAEKTANGISFGRTQVYDSGAHPNFHSIARLFLGEERPNAACFAVAGPITLEAEGEACGVTNLPWHLDSRVLSKELGIKRVKLINDFQAVGYGIEHLADSDMLTLQAGQALQHGVRAVIGAGTGLGQCVLVWTGNVYDVISTEGGHADFAPTSDVEFELMKWLQRQHGHVSIERVASGTGIASINKFLCERWPQLLSTALKNAISDSSDVAATLATWPEADPLARQTLALFAKVYGAQAGNLALTVLPRGGVYIAGGIAAKNIGLMQGGAFMDAFRNKGRMSQLMDTFPVRIITHPHVGLHGAMYLAARL